MKKIIRTVVWCLVGLFVIYTFYFLWKQSQPEPEVYELVLPQKRDIQKTTVATGKLSARREVSVKPQITGVITKVLVKPGDRVTAGQELAHVGDDPDVSHLLTCRNAVAWFDKHLGDDACYLGLHTYLTTSRELAGGHRCFLNIPLLR